MLIEEFGPVPVSRIKHELNRIFDQLNAGVRVLISRRGASTAVIEPHTSLAPALLAAFAAPGPSPLGQVSSAMINQVGPAEPVRRAVEELEPSFVTLDGHVYGVLTAREIVPDARPLTFDEAAIVDSRLERFLEARPDATIDDIAAFTSKERTAVAASRQVPLPLMFHGAQRIGDPFYLEKNAWNVARNLWGGESYDLSSTLWPPDLDSGLVDYLEQAQLPSGTGSRTLARLVVQAAAEGDTVARLEIARALSVTNRDAAIAWYRLALLGGASDLVARQSAQLVPHLAIRSS